MATANATGAPKRADHSGNSDPSMNEALRRARASFSGMSETDVDTHLAGNYFRQPAEPSRPLPTESGARRRAMNVRKV